MCTDIYGCQYTRFVTTFNSITSTISKNLSWCLPSPMSIHNAVKCQWHPFKDTLAIAYPKHVRIYDVARRQNVGSYFSGQDIELIDWNFDGAQLAIGHTRGLVSIIDQEAFGITSYQAHDEAIWALKWNIKGTRLMSCGNTSQELKFYSLNGEIKTVVFDNEIVDVSWVANEQFAALTTDRFILCDDNMGSFGTISCESPNITSLAFKPWSFWFAALADNKVYVSDVRPDRKIVVKFILPFTGSVSVMKWRPCTPARPMLATNLGNRLCLWDFGPHGTDKRVFSPNTDADDILGMKFSRDGEYLAFWDRTSMWVIMPDADCLVCRLRVPSIIKSIDWNFSSNKIAIACNDGVIHIHDLRL